MAKIMNLGAHCSECIHYQYISPFMYCMALQKRITARETYCALLDLGIGQCFVSRGKVTDIKTEKEE